MRARTIAVAVSLTSALLTPLPALSAPARLDIYVVLDNTTSMDAASAGMATLVDELVRTAGRQRNVTVAFGLGTVRDAFFTFVPTDPDSRFAYRRVLPLTTDRDAFRQAVRRVRSSGGGDEPEAQLIALEQSVLGTGRMPWVEQGHQAGFRAGARKAIVLVTDATFHDADEFYVRGAVHPERDDVVDVLRAHDVGVAALVVVNPYNNTEKALADYGALSAAVGPRSRRGYDLDRDRELDIAPGAGLVTPVLVRDAKGRDRTDYAGVARMLLAELAPRGR